VAARPPPVTYGVTAAFASSFLNFNYNYIFLKKKIIYFLIKQSIYNKLLFYKTFHNTNHFLQLKNNIFQFKNSTSKHIFFVSKFMKIIGIQF
jgi:hypothetical protein